MNFITLKIFFKTHQFKDQDFFIIDSGTKVTNPKKCVDSLVKLLSSNKGNKRYSTYYDILLTIYNQIHGKPT